MKDYLKLAAIVLLFIAGSAVESHAGNVPKWIKISSTLAVVMNNTGAVLGFTYAKNDFYVVLNTNDDCSEGTYFNVLIGGDRNAFGGKLTCNGDSIYYLTTDNYVGVIDALIEDRVLSIVYSTKNHGAKVVKFSLKGSIAAIRSVWGSNYRPATDYNVSDVQFYGI